MSARSFSATTQIVGWIRASRACQSASATLPCGRTWHQRWWDLRRSGAARTLTSSSRRSSQRPQPHRASSSVPCTSFALRAALCGVPRALPRALSSTSLYRLKRGIRYARVASALNGRPPASWITWLTTGNPGPRKPAIWIGSVKLDLRLRFRKAPQTSGKKALERAHLVAIMRRHVPA